MDGEQGSIRVTATSCWARGIEPPADRALWVDSRHPPTTGHCDQPTGHVDGPGIPAGLVGVVPGSTQRSATVELDGKRAGPGDHPHHSQPVRRPLPVRLNGVVSLQAASLPSSLSLQFAFNSWRHGSRPSSAWRDRYVADRESSCARAADVQRQGFRSLVFVWSTMNLKARFGSPQSGGHYGQICKYSPAACQYS